MSKPAFLEQHADPKNVALFLLFDAARNEEAPFKLEEMDGELACLLMGEIDDELAAVAPYVVDLSENKPARDWFFTTSWSETWGIVLIGVPGTSLDSMRRHLRHFTIVELPDRSPVYFRFYDPLVLTSYLASATLEQRRQLGGGIIKEICVQSSPSDVLICET